jgi:hypothetical protein
VRNNHASNVEEGTIFTSICYTRQTGPAPDLSFVGVWLGVMTHDREGVGKFFFEGALHDVRSRTTEDSYDTASRSNSYL